MVIVYNNIRLACACLLSCNSMMNVVMPGKLFEALVMVQLLVRFLVIIHHLIITHCFFLGTIN